MTTISIRNALNTASSSSRTAANVMPRILKVICRELFRVAWLVAVIYVANKILSCSPDDFGNECRLAGWIEMTMLTLPISIFWAIFSLAIGLIATIIGINPDVPDLSFCLNLIQVLFFVMLGYLQWFYIVPAVYKRYLKSRNAKIKSMESVRSEN